MENVVPDTNEPAFLKTRDYYIILGLFLGLLGIHNFYAGRYKTAVVQALITFCLFWTGVAIFVVYIWVIFEIFMVSRDGRKNLMLEKSSTLRIVVGGLMVFPGIFIVMLATWLGLAMWSNAHPEIGENVAKVSWLPASAGNVSFYKTDSWMAFEFDISEYEFRKWATRWTLKEIVKEEKICRYSYRKFCQEKHPGNTEEELKDYMNAEKKHYAVVSKGLYDSRRHDNGGGYNVVFDRNKQRAYFQSSPR